MKITSSFYHDPSERLQAVLGREYITSIIRNRSTDKSVMVLTDKRLYQAGKLFERSGARFSSTSGKKVVNVRDVTGTGFVSLRRNLGPAFGLVFLIPGLILLLIGAAVGRSDGHIVMIIGGIIAFLGILNPIGYYSGKERFFSVEYLGGAVATSCKWYSPDEIEAFQRAIIRGRESYRESSRSSAAWESSETICRKCGSNDFEYDNYFDEHYCHDCGWKAEMIDD